MTNYLSIIIFSVVAFAIVIFVVYGFVKVFKKAGEKWWYALVPIYNQVVLARIASKPWWWGILASLGFGGQMNKDIPQLVNATLTFLTLVALLFAILIGIATAKRFKRSMLFGVILLGIFSFIGYPIPGYGSSTYDKNIPT